MQFGADVDKATAGKLKITLHPTASLFKAQKMVGTVVLLYVFAQIVTFLPQQMRD